MFCTSCGEQLEGDLKFCTSCGTEISENFNDGDVEIKEPSSPFVNTGSRLNIGRIITILVIFLVVALAIYGALNKESIELNDQGVASFDTGNPEQAIIELEEASSEAVGSYTKMNTLINLGYVYSSELQYEQALQSFREARTYASNSSFEYFLISGEIALLEGNPPVALLNYNKAFELSPNAFQINNALNLFFLDVEDVASNYVDYPRALKHAQKASEVALPEVKNTAKQNLAIAHLFNENYNQTISLLLSLDLKKEPYLALWVGLAYAGIEDEVKAKVYLQLAVDAEVDVGPEVIDYLSSK